jgi:hypothetical protein
MSASMIGGTFEEALAERAALVLAAAIVLQAILDVEQGHLRGAALDWLRGDGATLAAFALKVSRAGWLRRIDELEARHSGWERGRKRRGFGTLMAEAA